MRIRMQQMSYEEKQIKKAYNKNYQKINKERLNKTRKLYEKNRRKKDNVFRIKCQVRRLILSSFNKKGLKKSKYTEEILGIDINKFYNYLLQTFKENYGVEWNGIEPVHIDHKKPLKYAATEDEVIKLCHYTNLQLLKANDNLAKGSKLNWKLQK